MRRVRFLRPVPPYLAGEEAGFDEVEARRLIARGLAVACEPVATVPEGAGQRACLEQPRPARGRPPGGRGRRRKRRGRGGRA